MDIKCGRQVEGSEVRAARAQRELTEHPLYADFLQYHRSHPETYDFFKKMAHKAIRKGYDHIGIKWLVEVGRWETGADFSVGSGFTHEYLTLYARLLTLSESPLAHVFELRKLKRRTLEPGVVVV